MSKEAAIKCTGIKKHYGEGECCINALRGIDLEIYQGELTLLVGPSGSGKTTLLSILTTILTADDGELFLLGRDLKKMKEREKAKFCQRHLGIVFQSLFLIPTLTVAENVALPLTIAGERSNLAMQHAREALKRIQLDDRANISPFYLSRGQQQRVAIARAIVSGAKILACDEPTSALDHATGIEVMTLLRELACNLSCAVLVVTHDHRIFSFSDRIIEMEDGQIISSSAHA